MKSGILLGCHELINDQNIVRQENDFVKVYLVLVMVSIIGIYYTKHALWCVDCIRFDY